MATVATQKFTEPLLSPAGELDGDWSGLSLPLDGDSLRGVATAGDELDGGG